MKTIHLLKWIFFIAVILCPVKIWAQELYWVFYTDKKETAFNPTEYFDIKAIERRVNAGISLVDSSDFPLNTFYTAQIGKNSDSVLYHSRWLNATAVFLTKNQLEKIENLHFVKKIKAVQAIAVPCQKYYDTTLTIFEKSTLAKQTGHLEGNLFASNQLNGKGIRIAIFDTGFPLVNEIPIFEHLYQHNQIVKTWDFVKKRAMVYDFNSHGTAVLSCIAGKTEKRMLGLAPEAEFLLARTEINREIAQEEVNWVAALEWADQNGAQIVNSSLGYTYHRYFPEEMDGKTSIVAKAAQMAAAKGMLIVNAMGNDGNNDWKVLSTPADADSILSVGAIDPNTLLRSDFSSVGPSADYRIKPNVVASGRVIAAGPKSLQTMSGTSFATPLISGFAACVWQKFPHYTNMQLIEEIQKSASLYPYFDYAHGYGIPKASYFISGQPNASEKSFTLEIENEKITVLFNKNFMGPLNENQFLYFHLADENNKILEYWVVSIENTETYTLPLENLENDQQIKIYFKGTSEIIKTNDL